MSTVKTNLADLRAGDVFSEESHYVLLGKGKVSDTFEFTHMESNQTVTLDGKYVSELLTGADQYQSEIEVGKEDKLWTVKQIMEIKPEELAALGGVEPRVGDVRVKGIRSIWSDIHSAAVFKVSFNKQGKDLSAKALREAKEAQLNSAVGRIEAAFTGKRGVAKVSKEVIQEIIDNPVIPAIKGEERILRGYKVQFTSVTGRYDVIDMDIVDGTPVRPVNVNEINWLVFNG